MKSFYERAQTLTDTLLKDRRWLHQHAEVGDQLPETVNYVMSRLPCELHSEVDLCVFFIRYSERYRSVPPSVVVVHVLC